MPAGVGCIEHRCVAAVGGEGAAYGAVPADELPLAVLNVEAVEVVARGGVPLALHSVGFVIEDQDGVAGQIFRNIDHRHGLVGQHEDLPGPVKIIQGSQGLAFKTGFVDFHLSGQVVGVPSPDVETDFLEIRNSLVLRLRQFLDSQDQVAAVLAQAQGGLVTDAHAFGDSLDVGGHDAFCRRSLCSKVCIENIAQVLCGLGGVAAGVEYGSRGLFIELYARDQAFLGSAVEGDVLACGRNEQVKLPFSERIVFRRLGGIDDFPALGGDHAVVHVGYGVSRQGADVGDVEPAAAFIGRFGLSLTVDHVILQVVSGIHAVYIGEDSPCTGFQVEDH